MKRQRSDADLFGDEPPPKRRAGRPVVAHRQRLVNAQAELAEIRAAKLRRELVPAADVEREWASILAEVRQRFLAIPSRIAAPREIVAQVDAEIRAALSALATQDEREP